MAVLARLRKDSVGTHMLLRYSDCRLTDSACAVFGGTYVLGASSIPTSFQIQEDSVELSLPCHPRPLTASRIISSPVHLPPAQRPRSDPTKSIARCIAVLHSLPTALKRSRPSDEATEPDGGENEEQAGDDDTAIVLFPPTEEGSSVVRGLIMGEGTGSCPAGQCESTMASCRARLMIRYSIPQCPCR